MRTQQIATVHPAEHRARSHAYAPHKTRLSPIKALQFTSDTKLTSGYIQLNAELL